MKNMIYFLKNVKYGIFDLKKKYIDKIIEKPFKQSRAQSRAESTKQSTGFRV